MFNISIFAALIFLLKFTDGGIAEGIEYAVVNEMDRFGTCAQEFQGRVDKGLEVTFIIAVTYDSAQK